MKRIVDRGLAKDMDLKITTNGTLTPKFDDKDIFDYIPEFKCLINISIEGGTNVMSIFDIRLSGM